MGFFRGIAAFFQGVSFVARSPRLWALALAPAVAATVLAVALGIVGAHFALAWAHHVFADGLGAKLVGVSLVILVVVLAIVLAVSLAQPLSGWALDAIARAQARALGSQTVDHGSGLVGAMRSAVSSL